MNRSNPERIWHSGTIYTMVSEGDRISAIASQGGRILATGSDEEILSLAGPETEIIDLHGGVMLPGFADAHTHMLKAAKAHAHELNLAEPPCRSIPELQSRLKEFAEHKQGEWILAGGVRADVLTEGRYPTRQDLDAAICDRPVVIGCPGSHVIAANSLALERAGIDADTSDPEGGRIDREPESDQPSGVLRETAKLRLGDRHPESVLPTYTVDQGVDALERAAQELLLPEGVTAIGAILVDGEELRTCTAAAQVGRMPVRMSAHLRIVEAPLTIDLLADAGVAQSLGNDRIKVGGVKISIDGGSLHRQAATYVDYPGEPGNQGIVRVESHDLADLVKRSHALGYRLLIHAIGERAIDMALSALEADKGGKDSERYRDRIEHFGNLGLSDKQLERASALGIVASPQPSFMWEYGDEWRNVYHSRQVARAGAFRSILEAGIRLVASSDYPVTPPSPLTGIQFAVTRVTRNGTDFVLEEAISVYEAIRMYTIGAAYAEFAEDVRGTIEPGKYTDLVVLDSDPFLIDPKKLNSIAVRSTIIGGQVEYSSTCSERY